MYTFLCFSEEFVKFETDEKQSENFEISTFEGSNGGRKGFVVEVQVLSHSRQKG